MRKLAHIEKIEWKRPIEGADKIELVGVLGWQCIAKINEFNVGDKCVYIEIDSIVDKDNSDFEFLEKRNYKIKTMKMRGVISQGIVFPMTILKSQKEYKIGDDVTDVLKITQVEDDLPKQTPEKSLQTLKQKHKKLYNNKVFKYFMKFKWFRKLAFKILLPKKKPKKFPEWIIKTDETRLQNMPWVLEEYKNKPMVITEKLDGTSTTFALRKEKKRKYDFAVCSRNVRQADINQKCFYDDNVYHEMAIKYDVKNILTQILEEQKAQTVVLQGETIGEAIQKNKYGLKGRDFYAFNLIIDGKKIDSSIATDMVHKYGIKWVPILKANFILLSTVDEMIKFADGKSIICDTLREGLVIRDHDNTVSFKCISNEFLLKHGI